MQSLLDNRRIAIYLLVAFGFSWALDLVVYQTGGIVNSRPVVAGVPITWALVLITLSMWGPALGNIVTRLLTREGWRDLWLRPKLRRGWRYWLAAWFLPVVFIVFGAALYFLIFPQHFDPAMSAARAQLDQLSAQGGEPLPLPLETLLLVQVGAAILLAPILNLPAIFGEEFGWRGYLQQKLMPLGFRRAMLWMGLIWGVWHWPVIVMGHNFGLDYPGYPWGGLLMMVWFTFVVGTFLGWATQRSGSVWPAVIGHGALNGAAGGVILFTAGEPNPLLGPLTAGLIGSLGWAIAAGWILWRTPAAIDAD